MTNTSIALNAYPGQILIGSLTGYSPGSIGWEHNDGDFVGTVGSLYIPANTYKESISIDYGVSTNYNNNSPDEVQLILKAGPSGAENVQTVIQADGLFESTVPTPYDTSAFIGNLDPSQTLGILVQVSGLDTSSVGSAWIGMNYIIARQ